MSCDCLLLDFFLNGLLLPHQSTQLLLLILQLLLHMVHLFTILINLLVPLSQLFVQLLDLSLVVVQLEELQLNAGSGHFVFQTLVALRLVEQLEQFV